MYTRPFQVANWLTRLSDKGFIMSCGLRFESFRIPSWLLPAQAEAFAEAAAAIIDEEGEEHKVVQDVRYGVVDYEKKLCITGPCIRNVAFLRVEACTLLYGHYGLGLGRRMSASCRSIQQIATGPMQPTAISLKTTPYDTRILLPKHWSILMWVAL